MDKLPNTLLHEQQCRLFLADSPIKTFLLKYAPSYSKQLYFGIVPTVAVLLGILRTRRLFDPSNRDIYILDNEAAITFGVTSFHSCQLTNLVLKQLRLPYDVYGKYLIPWMRAIPGSEPSPTPHPECPPSLPCTDDTKAERGPPLTLTLEIQNLLKDHLRIVKTNNGLPINIIMAFMEQYLEDTMHGVYSDPTNRDIILTKGTLLHNILQVKALHKSQLRSYVLQHLCGNYITPIKHEYL